MSTAQTSQIVSTSLDDTMAMARMMGSKLRGGEVIELVSDVGGGKTTFVRGLAAGMGSTDAVRSPSFTLSNQYKTDALRMYHFDFYRLQDPGIMQDELAEILQDPCGVVVVEWADIVEDVLPVEHIVIHIKTTAESSRQFTCHYPEKYNYLFKNT